MTSYLPLAFPQCPSCRQSWEVTRHQGCGGDMEVEPNSERARCSRCSAAWSLRSTTFYCSCGHTFSAVDVGGAIDALVASCRHLVEFLDAHREAVKVQARRGRASFRDWVAQFLRGLGWISGYVLGRILDKLLPI